MLSARQGLRGLLKELRREFCARRAAVRPRMAGCGLCNPPQPSFHLPFGAFPVPLWVQCERAVRTLGALFLGGQRGALSSLLRAVLGCSCSSALVSPGAPGLQGRLPEGGPPPFTPTDRVGPVICTPVRWTRSETPSPSWRGQRCWQWGWEVGPGRLQKWLLVNNNRNVSISIHCPTLPVHPPDHAGSTGPERVLPEAHALLVGIGRQQRSVWESYVQTVQCPPNGRELGGHVC